MLFRTRSCVLMGLFVLLQLGEGAEKVQDFYEGNEGIFQLQRSVDRLIEKILRVIEDFYLKVRSKYTCIPEEVPDAIMEILKNSIDCVECVEKKLEGKRVTKPVHRKLFRKCFTDGKKQVQDLMNSIDPAVDHCPENVTEKTYQINITTSFMKTFNIHIKNGLEITRKIVYFGNHTLDEDEDEEEYPETQLPESIVEYDVTQLGDGEYSDYDKGNEYAGEEENPDENTTETDQDLRYRNAADIQDVVADDTDLSESGTSIVKKRWKRNKQKGMQKSDRKTKSWYPRMVTEDEIMYLTAAITKLND